jgi:uncharacterized protein
MKYLLLSVILMVAWGVWRTHQRRTAAPPTPHKPTPTALPLVQMVPCSHCGMHIPQSEAVQRDGNSYCSASHAQRGPA